MYMGFILGTVVGSVRGTVAGYSMLLNSLVGYTTKSDVMSEYYGLRKKLLIMCLIVFAGYCIDSIREYRNSRDDDDVSW
jgi:hypothetical protein